MLYSSSQQSIGHSFYFRFCIFDFHEYRAVFPCVSVVSSSSAYITRVSPQNWTYDCIVVQFQHVILVDARHLPVLFAKDTKFASSPVALVVNGSPI